MHAREGIMEEIYDRLIAGPLHRFSDRAMEFIPNLLSAILILFLGFAMGWLVKILLQKFFAVIRLDGFSERNGITDVLLKSGLNEPFSRILARFAGGFVVFVFFLAALNSLEFGIIQELIERLFRYLPNILTALAILIPAYMLGNFLGRTALIAAVNAGMRISGVIGNAVKYLIYLLGVSMALEQLGIGRDTVLVSFGIIFSGVVLALAIAFGLGGKDVAREFLERRLGEKPREDDIRHL
jgi:hypothetical protein